MEDEEVEVIDRASEDEKDHEVIVSNYNSASEQIENESDDQQNSEDKVCVLNNEIFK